MKKTIIFTGITLLIIVASYFLFIKKEALFLNSSATATTIAIRQKNQSGITGLNERDLIIAGIKLGNPIRKYVKALPAWPKDKEIEYYATRARYFYHYPKYTIKYQYNEERTKALVIGVIITKDGPKTARGIGIGDPETEIFKRYGKAEKYGSLINYERPAGSGINFRVRHGKVVEIEVYFDDNPSGENNLTAEDQVIMGMTLDTPLSDYARLLPAESKPREPIDNYNETYFYYPDFTIRCSDNRVENIPQYVINRIKITGGAYHTARGIGIGASEREVLNRYGLSKEYQDEINYISFMGPYLIGTSFKIENAKVAEIEIYYEWVCYN